MITNPVRTSLSGTQPTIPRPRWNAHTTLLFALGSAALITALVALLVKRTIWEELQLLIGALSVFVFAFLLVVLFRGVRFSSDRWTLGWIHPDSVAENMPSVDTFGTFTQAGAEEGIGGFLLGLLFDIVASILLVLAIIVVLWLGANVVLAAVAVVWLPLMYLFRRSVRYIVVRGRKCRGDVWRSASWAAFYTAVNAGWLYVLLVIAHQLAGAGTPR